jgi:hypothetical protein
MPWGQEPIYKESEQDETYTNKGNKMYTVALEKRITAQAIALANRTRPYDIAETQVLTIPYGSTDPITLTRTEEGYYGYDSGVGRLTVKYPSYMAPDSYNTIYVQVDVPRELGLPMPNEHVYTSVPVDGIPLPVDPSSSERSTYTDTILVGGTMSVTLIGFNFCPDKQDGICDSETKKTRIYEYDQPTKWALNFQAPSREGTYESHIKIYPYAEHSDTPQWEGFVLILVANAQPTPTSKP